MAYSKLTEAELWQGMVANTEAIAQIARYHLAITKGRIDPAMQAKLIASDMKALAKLQREHSRGRVNVKPSLVLKRSDFASRGDKSQRL